MKKYHKILLYLIFLILTAGQAAAWEQSFESHSNDADLDLITGSTYSVSTTSEGDHVGAISQPIAQQKNEITISDTYNGYIGFSIKPYGLSAYPSKVYFELLDASNNIIYSATPLSITTTTNYYRFEYIETDSGAGVDCYVNGNLIASNAYLISPTPEVATIRIGVWNYYNNHDTLIDDITTSSSRAIIGCGGSTESLDSTFDFTVGVPPASDGNYWFYRVYDSTGNNLQESNISSTVHEIHSIPVSILSGSNTIRLYYKMGTQTKYFTSRSFQAEGTTTDYTIELDKSSYSPGDTIKVWTYVPDFTPLTYTESGYKIAWRVYTDAYAGEDGEETKDVLCYDLTSDDQYGTLVLPDDVPAGVGKEVRLVNPDGQDVAIATYDVLTDYNPSIEWSQDTYELDDIAKLLISQAPTGSTITFRVYSQNTLMQETTLDVTSSTGSKSINLADYTTGDKLLAILKNSDGYILDQDYATVRIGEYVVSGRVYDALTGAAVTGATVHIYTEDATTDEIGSYSLTARAGQWAVEISADGYNTYEGHVTIQDLISTRNFYIVPILDSDTSGIYGTVTSWATSKPIEGALVTVTKDSTTYSTTTNSRGYYNIEKPGLNGTCTVQASKSNYDTYSGYISVSGMTLLQVNLVANSNYDEDIGSDEDTSSSSSSSSISTSDRPDREAAKSTLTWLETNIPGVVQLVVFVFILALFGVKF